VLLALSATWHRTLINFETLKGWLESVKTNPVAPCFIVGAYLIGGLVFFPVTLLNVVTVLTFGSAVGNTYALVGWLMSASLGYGIGRLFGRDLLGAIASSPFERLNGEAERHGFLAVLTMRVLPVAPFTLVNLLIGASCIHFRDFFLGSLFGRIPGIVTLTLFESQLQNALAAPGIGNVVLLVVVVLFAPLAIRRFARHLRREQVGSPPNS
jgi:uncharacterized membrane protein YdjX (TVP38/TMEM64 family)